MKLHFELENSHAQRRPFTYQLLDTPSTKKFVDVTLNALKRPNNFPHRLSFGFRPNERDLSLRVERMNELIHIINQEGIVQISGELACASELSQERLNYLHLKFHEYEEQLQGEQTGTPTTNSLRELNVLIHQIEQNIGALNSGVFTQYLIFLLKETVTTPMDSADHMAKTLELRHGDLMLGYCTVGKSLFHCYKDNDLDLIKNRVVRDQVVISSEVICAFPQKDDEQEFMRANCERFYEWCRDNRVEDYGYDYQLPIHRPGNIPLGRIEQDYSYQEISEIFRDYQQMSLFEMR